MNPGDGKLFCLSLDTGLWYNDSSMKGSGTVTFAEQLDEKLRNLAKPPGSLGLWEQQVRQVFLAWGTLETELRPRHIIFAADNGVVHSGVVAQLADITYMQSQHMVAGTSAVTCFCRCNQIPYEVVDVGIDSSDAVGIDRKIAKGTADFSKQPAMTPQQYQRALAVGRERVAQAKADGCNFLSFGEMGIGNTTTSAAVLKALASPYASLLVGYGSAKGNYALRLHKEEVIQHALAAYKEKLRTPHDVLQYVGGFDLAALCGAMIACADNRMPFYIDGFITAVALACAVRIAPAVRSYALPSHLSREPGMSTALQLCGIDVYDVPIQADMSLGEGTGAVLAVTIMKSMIYAVWHMATLDGINAEAEKRHEQRRKQHE